MRIDGLTLPFSLVQAIGAVLTTPIPQPWPGNRTARIVIITLLPNPPRLRREPKYQFTVTRHLPNMYQLRLQKILILASRQPETSNPRAPQILSRVPCYFFGQFVGDLVHMDGDGLFGEIEVTIGFDFWLVGEVD